MMCGPAPVMLNCTVVKVVTLFKQLSAQGKAADVGTSGSSGYGYWVDCGASDLSQHWQAG